MNGYRKQFNAIVVGVGGMGSATCYQLARRGLKVLGLERFDIPHDMGSSHGYTRIIRLAYYEHPSYVMLMKRAYELWHELEGHSGERILVQNGSLDIGPADSWVFKGSLQSCIDHGLAHEVLTGKEISERWPGYQLPHEHLGVFQRQGGFLLPERATVAFVEAAQELGAVIHGREQVLDWEPQGDGVRVITERDEYQADSLIFTSGAWGSNLLPFLSGLALPERQVLAWLQPERPEFFKPNRFPVFNLLVDEGRYYGFPVFGVPGFKFGKYHHFEEFVDPDFHTREPDWEDESMLREFAARYFPQGAGPTMTLKSCMFVNSPDNHFIIDLHPQYPQVSYAAGFSGHGYKFASVIGEILADLAQRRETRHDIRLFNLERLTGQVSALYRDRPGRRGLPGVIQPSIQRLVGRSLARPLPSSLHGGLRHGVMARGSLQRSYRDSQIPLRRKHSGQSITGMRRQPIDPFDTTDLRVWEQNDKKPFWH